MKRTGSQKQKQLWKHFSGDPMKRLQFTTQKVYRVDGPLSDRHWPKPLSSVTIGRGKHKYEMLELYAGFDIETTTIEKDGGHYGFAYHFQLSLGTPRILNIYLFRKWEHLLDFLDAMAVHYGLGPEKHMILSVANLGFEHQFIRRRLDWDQGEYDFFAKEKYKPLKATYHGIEFREVLSLTGGNLAQLAKDYCTTQKLVGDLDFKQLRNSQTPLSLQEEQYTINDVVILSEFMWWLFCNFIRQERRVPMTFTGILHNEIKEELKNMCFKRDDKYSLKHGTSYDDWMTFMFSLQPEDYEYSLYMKFLFRGGYVHANALYAGIDGLMADMRDITSFYPTQMSIGYVPMTPFKPIDHDPERCWKIDEQKVKSKCLIIHAEFDYIRPKTTHTIESRNKIINVVNGQFDNGRMISCDTCEVLLTELDYEVYKMYYTWAGMTILECYEAERGPLPKYVQNVLHKHYKTKERLKRTGQKDTQEYGIAKARVNTCYGDLVKRLRLQKVVYDNERGWYDDPVQVDYYQEIKKSILSPYWGIWCTAWCRYTILKMIYRLTMAGVVVLYCDTDSIKFLPCHKANQMFKAFNAEIYRHRKNRKLRSDFFQGLGEFDIEVKDDNGKPKPVKFKSLGAKRYMYAYDDKVIATVAGMPKSSVKQLGDSPDEILKNFNKLGFRLTPEQSGKLTTDYTDEEYSAVIDGEVMTELSGVALYEIPFSINVKTEYVAYMEQLQRNRKEELKCL